MGRRITRQQILKHLRDGKSVTEIAEILNTTPKNVLTHRSRLVKTGMWRPSQDDGLQWALNLEQTTDLLIANFERAKQVPALLERIKTLENQKAICEEENRNLKAQLQKRTDQSLRYKLAVDQGEVQPAISSTN